MAEVGAFAGGEVAGFAAEVSGDCELIELDGQEGVGAGEQRRDGAVFVDGEIVDDGIHRERERGLELVFRGEHDCEQAGLGLDAPMRRENKTHAAAGHAAEHPETPEILAERLAGAGDKLLGVVVAHPRNHRLEGPEEIFGERAPEAADVARGQEGEDLVKRGDGAAARGEFGCAAEEVFLGGHLEDRTDVLGHAAVDEHEGVREFLAGGRGDAVNAEEGVAREETTAADAVFGIAVHGGRAFDEFDPGPESAGVLPPAAGAAEPLAENGAGGDDATFRFVARASERTDLAGGAHADADEGAEEVSGNGEAGALRDAVDAADEFETATGAKYCGEEFGEAGAGTFNAGRDEAGGNDGGFQQPKVVAAEIKDVVEGGERGGGFKVNAGEADNGFVDDAEERLDGWTRCGVAAVQAEVDGDVEDARALREIHAEEKNIGPSAVGEIHPHGGALAQERVGCVGGRGFARDQFGADAQRLVERVAEAEHPRVAAGGADGAADLVGEGLKREGVVRGGEGAGEGFARAVGGLGGGEDGDGLFETAFEQVSETRIGHAAEAREIGARGEVVAVDGGEEKQCADALVKVRFAASIGVELGAIGEEFGDGTARAPCVDGGVARRGIGGCDEVGDAEWRRGHGRKRRHGVFNHGVHGRAGKTERNSILVDAGITWWIELSRVYPRNP